MIDVIVIGGGMVGAALAYGCAKRGAQVAMIDEGDTAFRAAKTNGGLVWSQGKGIGMPAYAAWTRECIDLWPDFAEEISTVAGKDIGFRQNGGLSICLGQKEYEEKRLFIADANGQPGGAATPMSLVDRTELQALLPRAPFGPSVSGASYTPRDADVNPLLLLRAMHAGFRAHGGQHFPGNAVTDIEPQGGGYKVATRAGAHVARRVVIAAGLGVASLAKTVGIHIPIVPTRGQVMITERMETVMDMAVSTCRQTVEGGFQLGTTTEPDIAERDVSMRDLARIAARSCAILPLLQAAKIVRTWSGIRPIVSDGFPVYSGSSSHPGVSVAMCHSAVTLASGHARLVAEAILADRYPDRLGDFTAERFNV